MRLGLARAWWSPKSTSQTPLPTQHCLFVLNLSYLMKRREWNAQSPPSFDLNTIQANFCWVCSCACLLAMGWKLCQQHGNEKECSMRAESKHPWAPAENSQARGGLPSNWWSLWTFHPYRFDIRTWTHTFPTLIKNPSSELCSSHSESPESLGSTRLCSSPAPETWHQNASDAAESPLVTGEETAEHSRLQLPWWWFLQAGAIQGC